MYASSYTQHKSRPPTYDDPPTRSCKHSTTKHLIAQDINILSSEDRPEKDPITSCVKLFLKILSKNESLEYRRQSDSENVLKMLVKLLDVTKNIAGMLCLLDTVFQTYENHHHNDRGYQTTRNGLLSTYGGCFQRTCRPGSLPC